MSISINPENVFLYFNNSLCHAKAGNLGFVCVAKCVRYIGSKTRRHNVKRLYCCFKCKLAWLLLSMLFSRGHLGLMSNVKKKSSRVPEKCFHSIFT